MDSYQSLIDPLLKIAIDAGNAILEVYHASEGVQIEKKSDDSPLTQADKASNSVICDGLQKLPVQFPIVSEENKMVPFETRKTYEHYWLIDPMDGTKEFIKRNGEFTVNIALVKNNSVVLGVVYVPVSGFLYWAEKGIGAFKIVNKQQIQLKVADFTFSDEGLKVICSRSHLNEETRKFIEQLNDPVLISKGSSLKFLELAEGKAHLYPRVAPTMEWDTAAAQIILEEAGGKVLQYNTDKSVIYNKEDLLNPYFIASGGLK